MKYTPVIVLLAALSLSSCKKCYQCTRHNEYTIFIMSDGSTNINTDTIASTDYDYFKDYTHDRDSIDARLKKQVEGTSVAVKQDVHESALYDRPVCGKKKDTDPELSSYSDKGYTCTEKQ